ncbi:MAG TPA: ribosome maturation factor RimM [Rhodobacteraceae bacterium]|nr:ribosome maturation factor RimM [Paracoccaceae bacterium]
MDDNLICVGAIMGAFGVRGEVRLKSFCADPSAIEDYSPLTTENGESFDVKLVRSVKSGFGARLSGVQDKEAADALRGTRLYAKRDDLPSLPDDEYYHSDLIGLQVLDTGGALLGKVTSVQDFGAGNILEISGKGLKEAAMLPFTLANVPTVNLAAGKVIIDPPEGLFPDAKDE